jgi:isocitrate dehydrogenase
MYWAEGIANQDKDLALKAEFTGIATDLKLNEDKIVAALNAIQGNANNIGGYYKPTDSLADAAMRPNTILNNILASM